VSIREHMWSGLGGGVAPVPAYVRYVSIREHAWSGLGGGVASVPAYTSIREHA
jgi:hypothetical protein